MLENWKVLNFLQRNYKNCVQGEKKNLQQKPEDFQSQ